MNKLQKISALISRLPFNEKDKLLYIEKLIAVSDSEVLLDYQIKILINEIKEKFSLYTNKEKTFETDKTIIEDIRNKLKSLITNQS